MEDSILIFGGGELQLSIIETAKRLGYKTIVIDPDYSAKGKDIADVFIEVKGDDFNKTIDIAKEFNVKGLVTAATDHPILMMCKVADQLNLPFPSYRSCMTILDKGEFKRLLEANKIRHAKGRIYNRYHGVKDTDFRYPVIIKPLSNSGSRGVIKCDSSVHLLESVDKCLNFCKDGQYIIEEYLEGDEISAEGFVFENKVHILQITDKIVSTPPYNVELGHSQPSKYSHKIEEVTLLLQHIIDLTGLNNCAIHPEFKIEDGNITIIEMGPRLGGDFITSKLVPLSTGIYLEEILIKIATKRVFSYFKLEGASLITFLNIPEGKIVKSIILESELKKIFPALIEFNFTMEIGESFQSITNSLNRYGHYILQGDNLDTIKKIDKNVNKLIIDRLLNINS